MTFRRTLLLSTLGHIAIVYLLVSHAVPVLKPMMSKPELAHYVKVRLQLPTLALEAASEPEVAEESEPVVRTQQARPPKNKPSPPKIDTTQAVQVDTPKAPPSDKPSPSTAAQMNEPQSPVAPKIATASPNLAKENQSSQQAPNTNRPKFNRKQRRKAKQTYWSNLARFFRSNGYVYPKQALLLGQEGKVYIVIEIAPSGLIISAAISKSSGFPMLDQSALTAVLATKRVPPLPKQLKKKNRKFRIPIEYRLPT